MKTLKDEELHLLCDIDKSPIKLVSYDGLEEKPDYLLIDGSYVRILFISTYPFVANSGWLDRLIKFNHDLDISLHIDEVDSAYAIPKLQRKITELESTKRAMIKAGKIIGSEITDPLDSAVSLKNKILRGQEKLFQLSINLALRSQSLKDLERLTRLIDSTLASNMFFTGIARYRQLDGLQSVLPRAQDKLSQKRNLDSTSLSLCFPFSSSEYVQESGILYGVNISNNSLVMLDRFGLNNANSITFAQSGSGKSYASKVEIIRNLAQGTDVIVIDPEREYSKLADSVGGTVIRISVDANEHINPFDLEFRENTSLSEHIQDLTEIISLMADGLSSSEKAIVDKAIVDIYRKKDRAPTLKDFHRQISKTDKNLALRLDKYVNGSLSDLFTNPTNVNLNNRMIVFDIKDMSEGLRQIMMLIIAKFIQGVVMTDVKKRLLVIDEAWILMEQEQSAKFVAALVRRARKYWLGVSIISQQANDFLSNDYGSAIASQSSLRILMRQDTTTIGNVVEMFQLSEFEENYLLTCNRGNALIIADGNHVAVNIVASKEEHPLITTNPMELYGT